MRFAFYIFATYKVNNLCYPAGIPVLKANILVGLTDFFYNFERLDIFFIIWGSADFIRNIILFIWFNIPCGRSQRLVPSTMLGCVVLWHNPWCSDWPKLHRYDVFVQWMCEMMLNNFCWNHPLAGFCKWGEVGWCLNVKMKVE